MAQQPKPSQPLTPSHGAGLPGETRPPAPIDPQTNTPALGPRDLGSPQTGLQAGDAYWESLAGQVFDDFELLEEIGRGGMGIVYKARQKSLDRLVAAKILLADQFRKPNVLARFMTEAQAAAALSHPNIVTIYHMGQWPVGYYYVMEYLDGQTLEGLVRQRPVPISWAINLLIRISEAVHYAHSRGILHRDLKPANIIIDRFRGPVVLDFGIAKFLEKPAGMTEYGAIMGTPAFMSPEQAQEGTYPVGPSSDIYSLGAILYTTLTGRLTYEGKNALTAILKVISAEMPPSPRSLRPDVPPELDQVCMKCLSKRPDDRFPNAKALADELRRLRAGLAGGGASPSGGSGSSITVGTQSGKRRVTRVLPASDADEAAEAAQSVRLMVTAGVDKGLTIPVAARDNVLLGRSRATEPRLNDPNLSRIHCQVEFDGTRVRLTDFESTTGTYVNGKRIMQQELQPGDVIQIGDTQLRLLWEKPKPRSGDPGASAPGGPPVLGQELLDIERAGREAPAGQPFLPDDIGLASDAPGGAPAAGSGDGGLPALHPDLIEIEQAGGAVHEDQPPRQPDSERKGDGGRRVSLRGNLPSVVLVDERTGMAVRLFKPVNLIGRLPDCDLVLESSHVSKRHCQIVMDPDRVFVEDLKSVNGTLVNGRRIERCPLQEGDKLTVASYAFTVRLQQPRK